MKTMKHSLLVGGICLGVALSACFAGSVVEDVRFALAIRGDLNGNGKVDANEVGNVLDYSGANPVTASLSTPPGAQISFTNMTFAPPFHPYVTNTATCLYFPQEAYMAEDGTNRVSCNRILLDNATVPFDVAGGPAGAVQTAYVRFRWEGQEQPNFSQNNYIFINGYSWTRSGWGFYLDKWGNLGYIVPQKTGTFGTTITSNTWYDVFVTVSNKTAGTSCMTVYALKASAPYVSSDEPNTLLFSRPSFAQSTVDIGTNVTFQTSCKAIYLGAEGAPSSWVLPTSNNNNLKHFRGAIARMMFWNRELTEAERFEIAGEKYGETWTVGVPNGRAEEFGDVNPVDAFDPARNSWFQLRRTLDASHPSLTFETSFLSSERGMARRLTVYPLLSESAGNCPLNVYVNGVLAARRGRLHHNAGNDIYLPAKLMTANANGRTTITLTRPSPVAGSMTLDALALGGSFMLGKDNSSNGEFRRESAAPSLYFAGDTNNTSISRALLPMNANTGYHQLDFHVNVPASRDAVRPDYLYETRIIQQGEPYRGRTAWTLYVNGERMNTISNVADGTLFQVPIAGEFMHAGDNLLRLTAAPEFVATNPVQSYACFDFHRLTLLPPSHGTLLIVR